MSKYEWNCRHCGHDIDEHRNYELEPHCRCLSCWESTPTPCKWTANDDDDDDNSPICGCATFEGQDG